MKPKQHDVNFGTLRQRYSAQYNPSNETVVQKSSHFLQGNYFCKNKFIISTTRQPKKCIQKPTEVLGPIFGDIGIQDGTVRIWVRDAPWKARALLLRLVCNIWVKYRMHSHTHTPSPLPQTKRVGQHLWRWKQTHSLSLSSETLRQLQPCPWWRLWISRIVWRSWARSSHLFLGNCTRKCLEIITTINALINRHWPDNRACH